MQHHSMAAAPVLGSAVLTPAPLLLIRVGCGTQRIKSQPAGHKPSPSRIGVLECLRLFMCSPFLVKISVHKPNSKILTNRTYVFPFFAKIGQQFRRHSIFLPKKHSSIRGGSPGIFAILCILAAD
jgi:hypothetical protein